MMAPKREGPLADIDATTNDPVFLDARLYPYRSLAPGTFALVVGVFAAFAFLLGTAFWLAGAWPVMGFCGLEVALLWLAYRWSYRSALLMEHLHLTKDELVIERHQIGGRISRWSFQPYWLQVFLQDPPENDSPLLLASHGRHLAIGAFLPPAERLEVAEALRAGLRACREWRPGGPARSTPAAQILEEPPEESDPGGLELDRPGRVEDQLQGQ
jgi:uncharacterized membrane protein